jgi:hypothetical protein
MSKIEVNKSYNSSQIIEESTGQWTSFENFLLGDYSVFGNHSLKISIPNANYLISNSFEELALKMDLMGI